MDASIEEAISSGSLLLDDLDGKAFGPFRSELQALLSTLQQSYTNCKALKDRSQGLTAEMEAAHRLVQDVEGEQAELQDSIRRLRDEAARASDDNAKLRLGGAETEKKIRDLKARIAGLQARKALGSGWTADQRASQASLETSRDAAAAELAAQQTAVTNLRTELGLTMQALQNATAERQEADRLVAALKGEIADNRIAVFTGTKLAEAKDRELRDLQERIKLLNLELKDKSRLAEEAAVELAVQQEAVKTDRAALDKAVREYEKLRLRGLEAADEIKSQVGKNTALARELNELHASVSTSKAEAASLAKDTERLHKLAALTAGKIKEAEGKRSEVEGVIAGLKKSLDDLNATLLTETRKAERASSATEVLRREKDALGTAVDKAASRKEVAEAAVAFQKRVQASFATELEGFGAVMRDIQAQIDAVEAEKAKLDDKVMAAHAEHLAAMEAVKLQELQGVALQKKIREARGRLKQQQSLYETIRADRNAYAKQLSGVQTELDELKQDFKLRSRQIEALRVDVTTKDAALVQEHFDHHRVEKDKEALRSDVTRIQKQVQSCEQVLANQEAEVQKLNAIINEATAEKERQMRECEGVLAERNLLQGQMVKRDGELAAVYEKLRVHKSALANGAAAYAKLAAQRDELAGRLAALKGELLVAETQSTDATVLEREAKKLEADLIAERTKVRALTDELDRPLHVHRWREVADRDPAKWELLQRLQGLQKRALEARDEVTAREAVIKAKEKEYAALRDKLEREPGPELAETIERCREALAVKTKQLRALEGELARYRGQVAGLKEDVARAAEGIADLNETYVKQRKDRAAARAKRLSVVPGLSDFAAAAAGAGSGEGGSTVDAAALLDVTAELTGLAQRRAAALSRGGSRGAATAGDGSSVGGFVDPGAAASHLLPTAAVDAVKDQADRLLAAYGDLLEGGSEGGGDGGGAQ